MTTRDIPGARDDEAGITLVELIVYILLAVIVLGGIATIFSNAWQSQSQTTSRDAATGSSALVEASLSQSIRNTSDFKVESGGHTLRAIVATGTSTWECRAWVLRPGEEIVYMTSPSKIEIDGEPGWTGWTGWTQLISNARGSLAGGAAFKDAGTLPKRLQVGIKITKATQPVAASSGVTAQAKIPGGGPCW